MQEGAEYVRTLLHLFLGEVQIARGSFVRMLVAGALIPVFLLTIWSALNLLVAAIVSRLLERLDLRLSVDPAAEWNPGLGFASWH